MNVNWITVGRDALYSALRPGTSDRERNQTFLDRFQGQDAGAVAAQAMMARLDNSRANLVRGALGCAAAITGGALTLAGLSTLGPVLGLVGAGVVVASNWWTSRQNRELSDFVGWVRDTASAQPAPGNPGPAAEASQAREPASPPRKPRKEPEVDVLIDTRFNPATGVHEPSMLYEFPRPQPAPPRETITVIDMAPGQNGSFVPRSIYEVEV
ncbi:MAG: hypothetical protein AB1758_21440 [Candidatus Eremiobacterota bacterium]